MAVKGRTITVLGAGIAGLAAAVALARRGARVTVLERAPEITEVGAGLQITPNGSAVLRALGLGPHLRRIGLPLGAVQLRDMRGRDVVRLDMSRPTHGNRAPWLAVHRADLIEMLHKAAIRAGVAVLTGREAEGIAIGFDQVSLPLQSGTVRTAKILVGADGVRSIVRPAINVGNRASDRPVFTGQVAWRAVIDAAHVPIHDPAPRATIFMGPGRHVVTYPLRGGRQINVVAVEERAEWTAEGWNIEDDPANLLAAFEGWAPELRRLLFLAQDVHLWGLHRHPVARDWFQSRAVILGDAAHATLPFMAQGANMALEDAWVLAEEMDRHDDLQEGFAAYQARRRKRVERIVAEANGNAWKYHLKSPLVRMVAHAGLRQIGARWPERLQAGYDWIFGEDVTGGVTGEDRPARTQSFAGRSGGDGASGVTGAKGTAGAGDGAGTASERAAGTADGPGADHATPGGAGRGPGGGGGGAAVRPADADVRVPGATGAGEVDEDATAKGAAAAGGAEAPAASVSGAAQPAEATAARGADRSRIIAEAGGKSGGQAAGAAGDGPQSELPEGESQASSSTQMGT